MSRWPSAYNSEYDERDYHEEETPAQLAARRTRRRRRHGKKQGSTDGYIQGVGQSPEDYRGRWLPPASATSLTLAQLGIHVAPPARRDDEAASLTLAKLGIHIDPPTMPPKEGYGTSRNVVTMGDLGLFGGYAASPSPGTLDHLHASAPPPPPRPPQPWLNGAAPALERPCDRILSVPSPQIALHMAEQVTMHYPTEQMPTVNYPVAPPRPIQSQPATWSEPDPGLRNWLCSGQYGAQPIFHSPIGSNGTMPLASAPLLPAAPAPPEKAPTSPVAAKFAAKLAAQDKQQAEKREEAAKLEALLEHFAAEAYQD